MTRRPSARPSTRAVAWGVLVVSLLLAGVVSSYAASTPDGLTKVSEDQGFADTETDHATADSPLAGYDAGLGDDRLSGGLAGVVGVLVVLALGSGVTLLVRRTTPDGASDASDEPADTVTRA